MKQKLLPSLAILTIENKTVCEENFNELINYLLKQDYREKILVPKNLRYVHCLA